MIGFRLMLKRPPAVFPISSPIKHQTRSIPMTAANGRANGSALDNPRELVAPTVKQSAVMSPSTGPQFSLDQIKELIAELEVPFYPSLIEWRVTNTTKSGKLRGHVIPYADPRAYTDRLNSLFTPAGWTRKYIVHTSTNFERSRDQNTVAKVFVTCELTIFDLGSHSATGEEWTDDDNAGTSAEAQAFKRVPASDWGAIFIISMESGLTWMRGNDPELR